MSLQDKALLVSLSISQWSGQKNDPQLVQTPGDKYIKQLIPPQVLALASNQANHWRYRFNRFTRPWADGVRILPSVRYMEFVEEMNSCRARFEQAVDALCEVYPMHKTSECPDDIRRFYHAEMSFLPFPTSEDFRLDIPDEELAELKEKSQQYIDNMTTGLQKQTKDAIGSFLWSCSQRAGKETNSYVSDGIRQMCKMIIDLQLDDSNGVYEQLAHTTSIPNLEAGALHAKLHE